VGYTSYTSNAGGKSMASLASFFCTMLPVSGINKVCLECKGFVLCDVIIYITACNLRGGHVAIEIKYAQFHSHIRGTFHMENDQKRCFRLANFCAPHYSL
jgi:hypothetical protein